MYIQTFLEEMSHIKFYCCVLLLSILCVIFIYLKIFQQYISFCISDLKQSQGI